MPRPKSNTIESMGIEAFLIEHYGKDAYSRFKEMVTSGQPDSYIAKAFSTENRKLNYQTVGNWRQSYIAEGK